MKNTLLIYTILIVFSALFAISCNVDKNENKKMSQAELISRGEYIVVTAGCGDCHTPKRMGKFGPEEDHDRLLSGHPSDEPIPEVDKSVLKSWALFNHGLTAGVGPWGASFAANLTSDASGIGNWSLDQFKKALREGIYKGLDGSRNLLPPMPWPAFKNFNDEDIEAIFSYLKSTKPIRNIVPQPIALEDL